MPPGKLRTRTVGPGLPTRPWRGGAVPRLLTLLCVFRKSTVPLWAAMFQELLDFGQVWEPQRTPAVIRPTSVSLGGVNQFPAPPPGPHVTSGGGGGGSSAGVGGAALSHRCAAACVHRSARAPPRWLCAAPAFAR